MSELTEFLLARIAEDEAMAQDETRPPLLRHIVWGESDRTVAERVLAECAAKKAIVEAHRPALHLDECATCFSGNFDRLDGPENEPWPCPTLRALAGVYAGEPGWREEWA